MADLVRYERRGSIGVITVDNPPVNALSQGVRQGLLDALAKGIADPEARALVLIGGGRTFIAGTASDPRARERGARARPLADAGWREVERRGA